ncbi:MAG: hypothetical protein WDN01_19535 [Rhizomicrobium sp.]
MREKQAESVAVACLCGKVLFSADRAPILAASCYCGSCQKAGQEFANLPSAPLAMDADGGTPMVLYRKDRVRCEAGKEHLQEFRLKPDSPTRRVIATCCNAPMFLDFTKGHWLSIYRKRLPDGAPPIEMRINTKERRADVVLRDDVPNYDGYPGRFMLKLILAWIAMGFRRPDMGLSDISRAQPGVRPQ